MARKSGIELKKSTFKEKKMVGKLMEKEGIYKSLKAKERGGGLKKSLAISEVVRGRGNPLGWIHICTYTYTYEYTFEKVISY